MSLRKEDPIDVLSDKVYYTGAELQQCHDDNINTYVAFKEQPSVSMVRPRADMKSMNINLSFQHPRPLLGMA